MVLRSKEILTVLCKLLLHPLVIVGVSVNGQNENEISTKVTEET